MSSPTFRVFPPTNENRYPIHPLRPLVRRGVLGLCKGSRVTGGVRKKAYAELS